MQTYARGLRIVVIVGHVALCAPNSEDDQELLLQVSSESYIKRSQLISKT